MGQKSGTEYEEVPKIMIKAMIEAWYFMKFQEAVQEQNCDTALPLVSSAWMRNILHKFTENFDTQIQILSLHTTVAINELLCMKNAGAQIAMDFS